jgi:outer membrane protein assembly factor BamB
MQALGTTKSPGKKAQPIKPICPVAGLTLAWMLTLTGFPHCGANDWPQFLGPSRNGVCDTALPGQWPKEGPPLRWQKKVGSGFSGPAVSTGKLILFHRIDNKETIDCFDAQTGREVWTLGYPTAYRDDFGFDEGPRATPAIDESRVYTYGAEGMLHCIDFQTGKKLWNFNTKTELHASKGFFGIACSPLIEGKSLFLNVGGKDGAGVVAFDKITGKVLWKTSEDEASYSSPAVATLDGRRCALILTRGRLVGLEPSNGKLLFQFPFRPPINSSVTAAVPLIIGDKIFVSASYGTGAALLQIKDSSVKKIWESDGAISAHYATPVYHKGFLYGIHGRVDPGYEPNLRCVEIESGKLVWEQRLSAGTITLAGDELLILTERGELLRAPATSTGFKETARAQILPNQVRAHPALANGLFYARCKDKLVCVDLGR